MKTKKIKIIIVVSIVIIGVVFSLLISNYRYSKFTKNTQNTISEYQESGGDIGDVPELLGKLDIEEAKKVCNEEVVLDAIRCYRILAIKNPENKEEICSNINEQLCDRPNANSNCKEQIDIQKESCLLLFPMRG